MADVRRIAAFSREGKGGNPAGIQVCDRMPTEAEMLRIAKDVGYSETAFLVQIEDGWRVRYFAPEIEVPFCGHATVASGALLGEQFGPGSYRFVLNDGEVRLDVTAVTGGEYSVSLHSPETWSVPAPVEVAEQIIEQFNFSRTDVDDKFPIRVAFAGARHLIIVVNEHPTLARMEYRFDETRKLMLEHDLTTIALLWPESHRRIFARNAFASGGVYEDPATGAAAAATGGYLRDIHWPGDPDFEILQGEEMGSPSRLLVHYTPVTGESVVVSGQSRRIADGE